MNNLNPQEKMAAYFSESKIYQWKKKDIILQPGDDMQSIFFLKSGYVRMYNSLSDGKELTVNIFKPQTYFPLFLAFENIENTYFYQAMSQVHIQKASKNEVMNFVRSHNDILFDFTKRMTIGFHGLLSNLEKQLSGSVHRKVCSTLIMLTQRFGKQTSQGFIIMIPLTHQDIADLTGIARETASVELSKLQTKGCILFSHQTICIKDMRLLEKEIE
jgi:CRP/FNR family transcriptional regulator